MDIPLNVDVHCTDGLGGRSTRIILNPVTKNITHVVVADRKAPHTEYSVPIKFVKETTPELILLDCSRAALVNMGPFIHADFIKVEVPIQEGIPGDTPLWSYQPRTYHKYVKVKTERIPPHELEIRRGAHVRASDGEVGVVDEFLVEPTSGHITHLVLRKGHLWDQTEVTIPVSEIDRIGEDVVYLKLDRKTVATLLAAPLER
jgi:sporulation protein YlmC with PRC-barrel domain